jgi:hypothetical protein
MESEVVGTDDVMPQIMWKCYLIEAQCFEFEECILNQYNLSAVLL